MAQYQGTKKQEKVQAYDPQKTHSLPAEEDQEVDEAVSPEVNKHVQEGNDAAPPAVSTPVMTAEKALAEFQNNMVGCMQTVDEEVMKSYIPQLHACEVLPLDKTVLKQWDGIQFFRISEMVYEENEFSVHKLATVFNAMSTKPCTLVLMVQSDGQHSDFYLGVRSRDRAFAPGTMRKLLEQSVSGMFPGSKTAPYFEDALQRDLQEMKIGAVSSVTCIADYKQNKDTVDNKVYIQGLEKLIDSMRGKPFTMICLANNLSHIDLTATRAEYERLYTALSPFANMQYSYGSNESASKSVSKTDGQTTTDSTGVTAGISTNQNVSDAKTAGNSVSVNRSNTTGESVSVSRGTSHTVGTSDTVSESTTKSVTNSFFGSIGSSQGLQIGPFSLGSNKSAGMSRSVSRSKTHGTSHTESVSNTVSQTKTKGESTSETTGVTVGTNQSNTKTLSSGTGTQYSENQGHSLAVNQANTLALTDLIGSTQNVTLNVQNKTLINMLDRLEKQLERLDECESIGMWDFAAYFLGESAAETGMAAGVYRSLISGNQSGLELTAVNTWTDEKSAGVAEYVVNFLHPLFLYQTAANRKKVVDATALTSTNELSIQMGLPRKSVKGLPVLEYVPFAQEVLHTGKSAEPRSTVRLGVVNHFGEDKRTPIRLDTDSLTMHTFVTGSTGAGKSNTVYQLLHELRRSGKKFLVIEPAKGEYRSVFSGPGVSVYGTNPNMTQLLRINPFSFPEGVHVYEHMDRLIEIFNVCWPMYAAMPAVLKDAIERAYVAAGWDLRSSTNRYGMGLFPGFADVLHQIDAVINESQYSADSKGDYKGALATRLKSLTNGINGMIFCANELSAEELFDRNVIVDLSRVGSVETKALIMGLLVMKLQEYRMTTPGMNLGLQHVTVLEEAHNLLKRTSTAQSQDSGNLAGKSVEMLTNAIAEMRTYGEGFIIADQSPGLLDMAVIRNTNTKIILRLPEQSDRELVGKAAGLNDDQVRALSRLEKGVAAVYQNDWQEAVLCKVDYYRCEEVQTPTWVLPKDYTTAVQKTLQDALVTNTLWDKLEWLNTVILKTDLPAELKCSVLDCNTKSRGSFSAMSKVAYVLWDGDTVFAKPPQKPEDVEAYLRVVLRPSVAQLQGKEWKLLLNMLLNQRLAQHPEQTAYLKLAMRSVGKNA